MTDDTDLDAIRNSYDAVAVNYAEALRDDLATKPLDRAIFAAFAELVRDGGGAVADLGCGPGRITGYLDDLGLDVFGVDLSPGMIDVARRTYPQLRFAVGTMASLDVPDGGLGGIVAWYSTIHTPVDGLPRLFTEFHRALAPGGHLLLGFQVGSDTVRVSERYGYAVSIDVHRRPPDLVADLLARAGFAPVATVVREPGSLEKSRQASLLARKPTL